MTIIVILVALLVKADRGRHDANYAFTNYDKSFSGWGDFTFFIGLLPSAYTFSAVGMISSMAEQTAQPAVKVPRAISLAVPVEFISGLLFILPICFTMPPLEELITATYGQALPTLFRSVIGSDAGAFGLLFLVLVLTMCCSFSITTASSRVTCAFARDNAIPLSRLWYRIDERTGVPVYAFVLVNIIQVLLSHVYLGSPLAFTAFVSVGIMALSVSYAIPVVIGLFHGRREVDSARFTCGHALGTFVNLVAICWIAFEVVLFSMPMVLPVTPSSMNYASVVLVGFATISAAWYFIHARKVYKGPPDSDGIGY
ncbi:hypothetical protein CEP54_013800 [Fusarium duplospermum]|uniref:Amino acid permease n=1 Tax=Fusarium duplospermum TaxID=1325734 RepID=A0A428P0E7_9HYPO|nr:hypothetical protein CEP54_013800 [Fusarium duplospermum]